MARIAGLDVIRELLDEVHQALNNHTIRRIKFAWVKYIVEWPRSGPVESTLQKRGNGAIMQLSFRVQGQPEVTLTM